MLLLLAAAKWSRTWFCLQLGCKHRRDISTPEEIRLDYPARIVAGEVAALARRIVKHRLDTYRLAVYPFFIFIHMVMCVFYDLIYYIVISQYIVSTVTYY
jgi:hypothetical protein